MPVARTACDRSRETTTSVPSRPPSFREPSFIGTPDRILEIVSIVTFAGTRCRADPVLEFPPACVGGVAPTYGNRPRRRRSGLRPRRPATHAPSSPWHPPPPHASHRAPRCPPPSPAGRPGVDWLLPRRSPS